MPAAAATYDLGTDAGKVRLLAQDTDLAAPIFFDTEIDAFLAIEGGDVRLAAAQALDAIASSEAYLLKKITQLGGALVTDGPAVAKALRDGAKTLRDQVAAAAVLDVEGLFDIAEMGVDPFSRREILENAYLRGEV